MTENGALREIRTPDPRNRNPMLYPAELRALTGGTIAKEGAKGIPKPFEKRLFHGFIVIQHMLSRTA